MLTHDCEPVWIDGFHVVVEEKKPRTVGLRDGVISFVWNPGLASRVPKDVSSLVEDAKGKITAGQLIVPRGNF